MNAWMRKQQREAAAGRTRPAEPHRIAFPADGNGDPGPKDAPPPSELLIEATDPTGEVVDWFDDVWWMELLSRWKDDRLTVHILPTEAALLHPVVLHHVSMIKRVTPGWRVIAHGYCCDVNGDAAVEALATSAYDEVRLLDGARPNAAGTQLPAHALRVEDLFSRVRQIQRRQGTTRPVLVRAPKEPQPEVHVPADRARPPEAVREVPG
ncbi:MAG: hypothetical protein ACYSUQ_14665 [Planctomycetota bacterium]|jgi:hypothetical protein